MDTYIVEIEKIIREINAYEEFDEETNLLECGILTSLTLMYVISEIEDLYDITIEEELITASNFENMRRISEIISSKKM